MMLLSGVISLLTSYSPVLQKTNTILIIKYCLAGCDIGSALFGVGKMPVFKRMIQGALKFQGLKDLGHGPLSNFQTFTCTQLVVAIYEKLDPFPLTR